MSMTRGELARRTGCNPETVRYYEKIGLLPDPGRNKSGYRQYEAHHQERLRFIIRGRELGFSVDDIKGLLKLVEHRSVKCADVKLIAQQRLQDIRQKLRDLRRMERVLAETTKCCLEDDIPECQLIETLVQGRRTNQGYQEST